MAAQQKPTKQPAVVAELGRPETPEETAARKAENSRRHRANQTLLNLVVATIASLAIVLFLVVVVVRPEPAVVDAIDYAAVAAEAQGGADAPLLAPALPDGWYANDARFQATAGVPTWYIGFITPATQFIALVQGIGANPTWQAAVLDGLGDADATGSTTIDGITWTVFDRRDADDPGNYEYSMAAGIGESTIVLHGTAGVAEFELIAASIAASIAAEEE
jgi:hypothetical protein